MTPITELPDASKRVDCAPPGYRSIECGEDQIMPIGLRFSDRLKWFHPAASVDEDQRAPGCLDFQVYSPVVCRYCHQTVGVVVETRPDEFDEIVAASSMFRGPMWDSVVASHTRYPPAPRVASVFDNLLECASQYGVDVALSFRPQSPAAFGEYKEEIRIDAVIHETGTRFFQARMSTDSVRASLPGGPPALRQYLIDDIANALIQAMKEAAWR